MLVFLLVRYLNVSLCEFILSKLINVMSDLQQFCTSKLNTVNNTAPFCFPLFVHPFPIPSIFPIAISPISFLPTLYIIQIHTSNYLTVAAIVFRQHDPLFCNIPIMN